MKILTLWQPWATAIAIGSKRIETRSWSTKYRGKIAIHAGARTRQAERNVSWLLAEEVWRAALRSTLDGKDWGWNPPNFLPFGCIVAVANLKDCVPIELIGQGSAFDVGRVGWSEWDMGDYSPGRFAWVLDDVVKLETPVPCRGGQGLRDLDPAIEEQVMTAAAEKMPTIGAAHKQGN